MSLRDLLHRLRQLDAWLIWPALAVVIYGELGHANVLATLEVDVWDKALHFTAYFGLAVMTTTAVRADRRALWWALGLVVLGGVLELIQGATGRDADIYDELANTLGVVTGLGLTAAGIAILKALKLVDEKPRD